MDELWEDAGIVGSLPPDFVDSAEAQAALQVIGSKRDLLARPAAHREPWPKSLGDARLTELALRISLWVERYEVMASEALAKVSPRNLLNLAYFDVASAKLRGHPDTQEVPMRRWIWAVGAAGQGTRLGVGMAPFLQAAQDWRNLLMLKHHVAPARSMGVEALSTMEQDLLLSVRTRFAWGSVEVARQIVECADGDIDMGEFDSLVDYLQRVAHSAGWLHGVPDAMSDGAMRLASRMATAEGARAGLTFGALNSTRASILKPFVIVAGMMLPANLEAATTRLHIPILELARETRTPKQSAALMEQVCSRIFRKCPGATVRVGDLWMSAPENDSEELDVVVTNRKRTRLLDVEVKSQYEGKDLPTTSKEHEQGIGGVLEQLSRRRAAFTAGAEVTVNGTSFALAPRSRFIGLAVMLHDYSGLIWRPGLPGEPVGSNLITMSDLAVVVATLKDDEELFTYLEYREQLLSDGRGLATDEFDILSHFLDHTHAELRRQLRRRPYKSMFMVPPRDAHANLMTNMIKPSRTDIRAMLRSLPYTDLHGFATSRM